MDILTIVLASVAGILIGLLVTNSKKYDYTNIKFLTVEDFQKNMRKGQLIDIQKKDEFEKDKIKGARNFPEARISAASWAGVITSVEFAAAGGSTLDAPIFSIVGKATDGAIGADSAGLSGATCGTCLRGGTGGVCCTGTV